MYIDKKINIKKRYGLRNQEVSVVTSTNVG